MQLSLKHRSCTLSSLIAEGRRGAEPVSRSFFHSILSFLPLSIFSLSPSLSASFHWWPNCQQLLLWQAVKALHATEWYTVCFFFFFHYKSISFCPVIASASYFLISGSPNWGICLLSWGRGLSSLCFTAFSGSFLKLFALRHLVIRSVPYIRALMSQWPH